MHELYTLNKYRFPAVNFLFLLHFIRGNRNKFKTHYYSISIVGQNGMSRYDLLAMFDSLTLIPVLDRPSETRPKVTQFTKITKGETIPRNRFLPSDAAASIL